MPSPGLGPPALGGLRSIGSPNPAEPPGDPPDHPSSPRPSSRRRRSRRFQGGTEFSPSIAFRPPPATGARCLEGGWRGSSHLGIHRVTPSSPRSPSHPQGGKGTPPPSCSGASPSLFLQCFRIPLSWRGLPSVTEGCRGRARLRPWFGFHPRPGRTQGPPLHASRRGSGVVDQGLPRSRSDKRLSRLAVAKATDVEGAERCPAVPFAGRFLPPKDTPHRSRRAPIEAFPLTPQRLRRNSRSRRWPWSSSPMGVSTIIGRRAARSS